MKCHVCEGTITEKVVKAIFNKKGESIVAHAECITDNGLKRASITAWHTKENKAKPNGQ